MYWDNLSVSHLQGSIIILFLRLLYNTLSTAIVEHFLYVNVIVQQLPTQVLTQYVTSMWQVSVIIHLILFVALRFGNSSNMQKMGTMRIERGHGEALGTILKPLTVNTIQASLFCIFLFPYTDMYDSQNIIPCIFSALSVKV